MFYSGGKEKISKNSWAYTRLGKMNIPEDDVTELLSNGDITLKIATSFYNLPDQTVLID